MNEKLAKKTLLDSDEDGSDSSSLVVDDADAENLSHDTPPTSSYNHPSCKSCSLWLTIDILQKIEDQCGSFHRYDCC